MAVTINDVEHVARLARLEFNDAGKKKFMHQLNDILKYIEKLNELDTATVEPLLHVNELNAEAGGMLRDDEVKPSLPQEEVLKNAPDRTEKFFKVPKVIGDR